MKNFILITLFLLTSFFCKAQDLIILKSGDTLRGAITSTDEFHVKIKRSNGARAVLTQDMIKKIIPDPAFIDKETAGGNLIEASQITFGALVIEIVGMAVAIGGISIAPAVAIVGGGIAVAGWIYSVTAWKRIQKAGEILNKNKL